MSELYTFTVDGFPADHFKVHVFTGRETISEPYTFDIVVTSDGTDGEVERLALGQRAVLSWNIGMAPRAFNGILAAIELEEIHETAPRSARYRMRLAPRLWLLKRKRRTRIFQQLRVRDIVDAVLGEAGIATRWALLRDYPVREYCTQYEESDYRFLTRLLAESGIYFFFPEGGLEKDGTAAADALIPGDSIIFSDDATGYRLIGDDGGDDLAIGGAAPPLYFLAMQQTKESHADKVTRFAPRTTVRASTATFRDYDPERPMARLVSSAESTQPFPSPDTSILENVVAAFTSVGAGAPPGLEVFEHHGPFLFPKWSFAKDEAPLILRQKRRRASVAAGDSGCPDLAPGRRFGLENHPAGHLNREYVVTTVEHRGETRPQSETEWRTYRNTFSCAPADVAYIPPRPKRRSVQVALTAIVVGPSGEDIYVDALGQIKVQFHWDRDGVYDDRSSCWIRTMHAWGGAGWGAQFIPRVGMEVVVVFEGGDTDKPMVLGSLYNGTHPSPFMLPGDKTRSGWRTQSSPGGDGFNELSFEDAAGAEQIYLRAQKNLDEVVEHNHSTDVRGAQSQRVDGEQTERIGKSQSLIVQKDRNVQVERNQSTRIAGRRQLEVAGDDSVEVSGNGSLTVAQQYSMKSQDNFSLVVGTDTGTAQSDQYTHGTATIGASERVVIRAMTSILLSCGDTSVELTPDKLTLKAPTIEIKASKGITATGDGPSLKLDDQVQLVAKSIKIYSESAALELDKNATMKGEKMLLNCDAGQPSPPPPDDEKPPTQPFSVKLTDYYLKPLAGKKYHLMCEGLKYEGETDSDGHVQQDLPTTARQVNINLWLDAYPTGRQRLYTLSFGEVPEADTPKGAHSRLKHLGYLQSEPGDALTEEVKSALTEFQQDHKDSHSLEPTGELDGPTTAALKAVYGS